MYNPSPFFMWLTKGLFCCMMFWFFTKFQAMELTILFLILSEIERRPISV
jgi:hypothetical protein